VPIPFPLEVTLTKRLVAFLFPFLLVFTAAGFGASPQDEANAAARAMVDRFADSWNRADGAAYGENYWPDAELVDPSGVILTGRAAIVKEHVDLWAGIFRGTHQTVTVRRVQVLSAKYILVDFDAYLSGVHTGPSGGAPSPAGVVVAHLKHIMQNRNGEWGVLFAQNTLVATSPQPR
jgi:uncharacterized protein (TIGR02246 family)